MKSIDVAIIGAGAAGLAAAVRLRRLRPALSILVIEAADRIGGRAWTINAPAAGNIALDLGCGWLHGAQTNAWTEIARQLGHAIDTTPAPWDQEKRNWGLAEDDAHAAKAAVGAYFERVYAADVSTSDTALSSMLQPGGRWNGLLEAMGTYISGAELSRTSLIDFNRYDPGPSPDWRLPAGYGTLISAFGADATCRLGTTVNRIDHRGASAIRIGTSDGTVDARAVIVTVSTTVIAAERIRFDPPLPDKAEAAAMLPLGIANKLFLNIPPGLDLEIDGHLLGSTERRDTASYQMRPFGNPVIEAYFGGPLALDMENAGPAAALEFARDELAAHLGNDVRGDLTLAAMSAWAADPHVGGSYSYAKPGGAYCRETLGASVDSRIFFAGEACSPARFSTAHGAYESGIVAADEIIATFAPG